MTPGFPEHAAAAFAPTGQLRVSINVGNPLLARLNAASNVPEGLSVDIARDLASRLGVEPVWVISQNAAASVQVMSDTLADVGFFAIDPARAGHLAFSAPYLDIEGAYLVRQDAGIATNDDVDRPGNVVVVSRGSAYDHFLTRHLRAATLDRSADPLTVVDTFLAQDAQVAAGIRSQLLEAAARDERLRVLDGRFMVIEQALAIHRTKPHAMLDWLQRYLETIKRNGLISASMQQHEVRGASVSAPRSAHRIESG